MSIDADFTFHLSREVPVADLQPAAEAAGWSFEDDGDLAYAIGPDLFDWIVAAQRTGDEVVRRLESVRVQGEYCAFILTHREGGAGCIFIVADSGRSVTVTPNKNIVPRRGLERFADGEWYLGRLLPVFSGLPLVAYSHTQDMR
ncbi:hypothetical protein GCM10009601_17230 [Streptomyces thermospinosisporus]|uniref:Uncharacterized protein n=1 Tax=Streptomyces thermospinosisporus TaxID=161482 RepID=A0ABN1YPZ5_9ACTN